MSRAERRQYQRMMKGADPYAPPPPKGGGRPPRRRGSSGPRDWSFNRGFWWKSAGGAAVVGIAGLSIAWSSGPERAAVIGVILAAVVMAVLVGLRMVMQRRASSAARPPGQAAAR
jgi:hypothetical protein